MQPLQICIGSTIRIDRESWCLQYAGFLRISSASFVGFATTNALITYLASFKNLHQLHPDEKL